MADAFIVNNSAGNRQSRVHVMMMRSLVASLADFFRPSPCDNHRKPYIAQAACTVCDSSISRPNTLEMPRGVHVSRVLPNLSKASRPPPKIDPQGPKLYNGKRRIQSALGIKSPEVLAEIQRDPFSQSWRQEVSEDVAQFVDDMEAQGTKLLPEEQKALLTSPAHYFSRPQNVPVNLREQVYFPDFSVTMRRQTIYGPYYAQFEVPLWFSKLDLKGYLKQVYNVDVVHIRSYTTPALVMRKPPSSPYAQGPLYRAESEKRMLVQLVEPFEWPVKPKDVDKAA